MCRQLATFLAVEKAHNKAGSKKGAAAVWCSYGTNMEAHRFGQTENQLEMRPKKEKNGERGWKLPVPSGYGNAICAIKEPGGVHLLLFYYSKVLHLSIYLQCMQLARVAPCTLLH